MVEMKNLETKKGELMTTKDGKPLISVRFTEGDEFIPSYNTVHEKTNEVEVKKGKNVQKQSITNWTLKCRIRNKDGSLVSHEGQEELFVSLTGAQAKNIKKQIEAGVEINQHLWVVYKYTNDFGEQLGVAIKKAFKPAKSFADFDNATTESTEE